MWIEYCVRRGGGGAGGRYFPLMVWAGRAKIVQCAHSHLLMAAARRARETHCSRKSERMAGVTAISCKLTCDGSVTIWSRNDIK